MIAAALRTIIDKKRPAQEYSWQDLFPCLSTAPLPECPSQADPVYLSTADQAKKCPRCGSPHFMSFMGERRNWYRAERAVMGIVKADHRILFRNLKAHRGQCADKRIGDLIVIADNCRAAGKTGIDKPIQPVVLSVQELFPLFRGIPENAVFRNFQSRIA